MKKLIFILTTLWCLLHVCNGYSQTVSGIVVDSLGNPVSGVVVINQSGSDSISINVTITNIDGRFELKITSIPYRLLFQHISYQKRIIEGVAEDLKNVVLENTTHIMSEVIVSGERPIVKVEQGRLIYDVGLLSENKVVKNAYEAIAELPAVWDNNGSLELMGASRGTTVIINGKPSVMSQGQLSEFLKSTPVERLEKVETSYNAPPQWHIVGAAINIIVKREQSDIKGQLQTNYSKDKYNSYDGIANIYVASKKISADFMASYRDFIAYDKTTEHNEHYVREILHNVEQTSEFKGHGNKVTLYGSLGYKIKEDKSLFLSYYGDIQPWLKERYNTQNNYFGRNRTDNKMDGSFHGVTFEYESNKINTGISYSYLENHDIQRLTEDVQEYHSTADQTVNRINAYADIKHTFSKNWNLGYGAMATYVKSKSNQTLTSADQKSNLTQDEYTANAYVNIGHGFKNKTNLSLTLMGEYYTIENYRKFNFLPNLSLTCPISEKHTIQYSFSTMRDIPPYSMQRDYINYIDAYKLQTGNPAIRPATVYINNLTYILKNKYIFSLSHTYIDHNIQNQWYMDPDTLTIVRQPLNINFASITTASVSIPFNIGKFWMARLDVVPNHRQFKADDWHGISYNLSSWSLMASLNNTFKISTSPKISLTLRAFYSAPALMGIYKTSTKWYINTGANYTFAKDRAIITVTCYDIFQSGHTINTSELKRQYQYLKNRLYTRTLNLSLTYKFGGYTNTRRHDSNIGADRR